MPDDKNKSMSSPAPVNGTSFRKRYDELERQRLELTDRLNRLGDFGRAHPAYRKAKILLNQTFRKASIVQRVAILQAADWLIGLIEIGVKIV